MKISEMETRYSVNRIKTEADIRLFIIDVKELRQAGKTMTETFKALKNRYLTSAQTIANFYYEIIGLARDNKKLQEKWGITEEMTRTRKVKKFSTEETTKLIQYMMHSLKSGKTERKALIEYSDNNIELFTRNTNKWVEYKRSVRWKN